ncbi:MAG: phosphatase PAP2 family protein [Chitinophagaceae bacterium]
MKKFCFVLFLLSFISEETIHAQIQANNYSAQNQKSFEPNLRLESDAASLPILKGVFPSTENDIKYLGVAGSDGLFTTVRDSLNAELYSAVAPAPISFKTFLLPTVLIGYGALTINHDNVSDFNKKAQEIFYSGGKFIGPFVEDYLLWTPALSVYALNLFGVKGRNNFVDRSALFGMSSLIAGGIFYGIKQFGFELRPDSSDKLSFPSGHTTEAFVCAEFLREEYRGKLHWSVFAGGYAVAIGVGCLRMYHNKHWLSDVAEGAGIGIAATRFSYFLYPKVKQLLFGSKIVRESAMIMPIYQIGGGYGLAFSYRF